MSQRCSLCSVNYPPARTECLRCGAPLKSCDDPISDNWANIDVVADVDERTKVELWRLHVLVEAGYSIDHAEQLARAGDVDLHTAAELILERGCQPDLAAAIML